MDVTGKQDVYRGEEDEKTMSLLRFQAEKKSLFRTMGDEEVKFEAESERAANNEDDVSNVQRTVSTSSNSTRSVVNSWCFMESSGDEKKEDLLPTNKAPNEKQEQRTTTSRPDIKEDDNKTTEKSIMHVDPESRCAASPASKSKKTTCLPPSPKSSPSSQSSQ